MVEPTAHYYPRSSTTTRRANSLRETPTAPVHGPFTSPQLLSQDNMYVTPLRRLPVRKCRSSDSSPYSSSNVLTPHQYPASFPSTPFPTYQNGPSQYAAAQDASGTSFMTTADPFYPMTTTTTSVSSPQHLPTPFLAPSPGTSSGGSGSPPSTYGTADTPEGYYRCECNSILSMLNRSKNHATHEKSSKHRKALGLPRYQSKGLFCRWCDKEFSRHDACNRHQKNCPEGPGGKGKKRSTKGKQTRRKARSASVERDEDGGSYDTVRGLEQYQSASAPIANALSPASFPGTSSVSPPLHPQPRLILSPPTLLSQAAIPPIFLDASETIQSPSGFHPSLPGDNIQFFDEPQSMFTEPQSMFSTEPQSMFTEPQSMFTTTSPALSRSLRTTPDLYYGTGTGSAAPSRLSSMDSFLSDPGQGGSSASGSTFPGSIAWDELDASSFAASTPLALPVVGYHPNSQVFDWGEDTNIFGQAPYATSPPSYAHHPGRFEHGSNPGFDKVNFEDATRRRPS